FPVTVNPAGLGVGTYNGTINVSATGAANSPLQIPVILKVANDAVILMSVNGCSTVNQPCPLTFAFQTNQAAPQPQTIQLTSSTGAALTYTTAFSSMQCPGNWLALSPSSGSTPANISVSVNPTGLAAGRCDGTITVNANNASGNAAPNSPLTI